MKPVPTGDIQKLLSGQIAHDARFHRDIQGLTLGPRLQHLTLHFAKYVGRLAESSDGAVQTTARRTLIDCLIIGFSACNALGIDASELLATARPTHHESLTASQLAILLAGPVGRLAKACEALDHLEDLAYASHMRRAIVDIVALLLPLWSAHGSLAKEVRDRWEAIESGQIA